MSYVATIWKSKKYAWKWVTLYKTNVPGFYRKNNLEKLVKVWPGYEVSIRIYSGSKSYYGRKRK